MHYYGIRAKIETMKRNIIIFLSLLILGLSLLVFIQKRTALYLYTNPYTETSGFKNITKVISNIDEILSVTKATVKNDGYDINYLYKNPYGSGFLKNNPIPNDLDFAVGVYIGQYEYTKENAQDIAIQMIDIIKSFYYNLAINLQFKYHNLYLSSTPINVLSRLEKYEQININDIISTIDNVVTKSNYVKLTTFENVDGVEKNAIKMPYALNSNEILLQELKPLIVYSNLVTYNDKMTQYIREISLTPEFYAKIKHKGHIYDVELVPEAFKGVRLQLSRRCFASTIFTDINSYWFLKKVNWLNDDNMYIKYRLLSYKRHLQEIKKLANTHKSPVKILKRIMQTTDIIKPLLTNEQYNEYAEFVSQNLNNKDIQLLNDYLTIYNNVSNIYRFNNLRNKLLRDKHLQNMHTVATNSVEELKNRNNIDKKLLTTMQAINQGFGNDLTIHKTKPEEIEFLSNYSITKPLLEQEMLKLTINQQKILEFIELNNKLMNESGFHEVTLYWLDDNKIGILKDDFTKGISNLDDFAKNNGLPQINYTLINAHQLPQYPLKFVLYAHNYDEDEIKSNKLIRAFLQDKQNFNIKHKTYFN